MLGPHAEGDGAARHVLFQKPCTLLLAERDAPAVELHAVFVALADELCVKEIHDRHADKARHEEIRRVVEHLLRGADLLDVAVAHDDDAVAEGHGLGLVVGDVDKGGFDALAQLDDLGAHLVAELGVEVGKRLVHQHHLRRTHDGAPDGHALALAAGEGLGLAVEIVGDVQNLRCLPHLLVDHVPPLMAERQGKCHVFIHGHVREEGVVLEDHGDVPLLGVHIVHELAVDIQLPVGNFLQPRDHAQRGGFPAAGGADQNDKLLIRNVQIERLHRHHALLRDLEVGALFLALAHDFFQTLALLGGAVGINFLDVM